MFKKVRSSIGNFANSIVAFTGAGVSAFVEVVEFGLDALEFSSLVFAFK